jgi:hypothetical protein
MSVIDTLEVWGPGGEFAYLIVIDPKGDTAAQLSIGSEPGAISLHREFTIEGDGMVIHIKGDNGHAKLLMSVESAAKLAEALMSLSRNPQGDQN